MSLKSFDSDFDRYRKNRIRYQNKELPEDSPGYENSALRELERVEAREVRDQQLTREVHEFFATATQQAAGIVERMAHEEEVQADVKVEQEMESFLIDAFARMNTLVMALMHKKESGTAEERLEPKVANLVGSLLDEFRWEGTADLMDKHIGQDPFATDLDDVRRELQVHASAIEVEGDAGDSTAPIEEHLVAAVEDSEQPSEPPAEEPTEKPSEPLARLWAESDNVVQAPRMQDEVDDEPERVEPPAPMPQEAAEPQGHRAEPSSEPSSNTSDNGELERFKQALKSLVRQGTMTRDEARAAWVTRLKSLGVAGA